MGIGRHLVKRPKTQKTKWRKHYKTQRYSLGGNTIPQLYDYLSRLSTVMTSFLHQLPHPSPNTALLSLLWSHWFIGCSWKLSNIIYLRAFALAVLFWGHCFTVVSLGEGPLYAAKILFCKPSPSFLSRGPHLLRMTVPWERRNTQTSQALLFTGSELFSNSWGHRPTLWSTGWGRFLF